MTEIIAEILKVTIITGIIFAAILVILIWVKDQTKRISVLRVIIQMAAISLIAHGSLSKPLSS